MSGVLTCVSLGRAHTDSRNQAVCPARLALWQDSQGTVPLSSSETFCESAVWVSTWVQQGFLLQLDGCNATRENGGPKCSLTTSLKNDWC